MPASTILVFSTTAITGEPIGPILSGAGYQVTDGR